MLALRFPPCWHGVETACCVAGFSLLTRGDTRCNNGLVEPVVSAVLYISYWTSFMLRYLLHCSFIIAVAASAVAAQPEIRPGQYVLDYDRGTLTIRSDKQNRRTFEIKSIGGNCHTCSLSGVIQGSVGHADDSECVISFSADRSTIVVKPITEEECSIHCGARARFDGSYVLPPAACTSAGRQAQRDRSLTLYRSHHYSQAASTLQTLITRCEKFMNSIEIDQARNDLALSQYHNGKIAQCLETLNATLAGKVKDEEGFKHGGDYYMPPSDFENYIGVARAIWFNKALCTKAMTKGR